MSSETSKMAADELSVLVSSNASDGKSDATPINNPNPPKTKNKFFRTIKYLSWIWLVCVITGTPVAMDFSHYSTKYGQKVHHKYSPPSVLTLHFFTSIIIGSISSYFLYGVAALQDCFRLRPVLLQTPVSVGYAISEILALSAMRGVNPITYAVIHKIRLILTSLCSKFLLGRHVSLSMWLCCFCVTSNVMGFVLYDIQNKSSSDASSNYILGILLLVANISTSVLCSIYADHVYKMLKYPLTVQMAQGRISATMGAFVVFVIYTSYYGFWSYGLIGGPKGGWDFRVVCLYLFMIVRDWTTCFVLLYLDAVWKALAGSTAVASTYLCDVMIKGTSIVPAKVALLSGIVFTVALYTVARRDTTEYNKMNLELAELKEKLQEKENSVQVM